MAVLTRQRHHYEHQDLWDKFWKDDKGNYVIWQWPNKFLIAWAILTLISLFINGTISTIVWWLALIDLAIWAGLEIWKGVNYFRRVLGVVVLIMTLMAAFKVGY